MKRYIGAVAILVMNVILMGAYSELSLAKDSKEKETPKDKKQHDFETLMDRFSYAYGADLAEKFKEEGIILNVQVLASGMQDAFEDSDMKMSSEEIIATLDLYKQIHIKKKETEWAAASEKNKKEGKEFLVNNAKKKGVKITASGLQYKVITEGNGGIKPTENDEVSVHYRGTFIDGTEFDSTHQRDEAYTAKVKQLIHGWSEALQLMSEGARWELYIPADIAYGEQGSGEYVGPNAVLIFEVELVDIKKEK